MAGFRSRFVVVGAHVKWSLGEVIVWARNGKSIKERVAPATRARLRAGSALRLRPTHFTALSEQHQCI